MRQHALRVGAALLVAAVGLEAAREIKPGFNLFSRQQDIQLGKEAQQQVEKQLQVVNNQPQLESYITQLGSKLAGYSQAPDYPYSFHIVADKAINAFALPGGPVYVNTATIAAAENEAQLAGVMAHEISHVVLRHSTNEASKAYAWQIPLAIAGAAAGGSLLGQLTQLGLGLGVNSVLLKYSRDAEHDADILGARTMAKAGYDPVEMARFFEKLKAQGGGSPGLQFLSDHPDPGNRVQYVSAEVQTLPPRQYTKGSSDFSRYRDMAARVPVKDVKRGYNDQPSGSHPHPEFPSAELREFRGGGFRLSYPANWQPYGKENDPSVTIAPREGLFQDSRGAAQIGMGAIAGYFSPDSLKMSIAAATDQLVQDLRAKNPDLRLLRGQRQSVVVDGSNGETLVLTGASPFGNEREIDSLLTATRPEGLFYLVLIAPESDYNSLRPTFVQMQHSVRFH
ncbi:MAG TPA: M48 family metallopeptidase [Bryobacterales bacterium]|nr:M48 family metallopeptidase [Bryobacterales bacterium]